MSSIFYFEEQPYDMVLFDINLHASHNLLDCQRMTLGPQLYSCKAPDRRPIGAPLARSKNQAT